MQGGEETLRDQVASYCRVSTDKDDQANSFESQQRYFRAYIDRQPEWELYQIYADEGITGNSHFMFQELNNDVIADHIENWIQENVDQ